MSIDKVVSVQILEIILIKCFGAEYRAMLTTVTEMVIKKTWVHHIKDMGQRCQLKSILLYLNSEEAQMSRRHKYLQRN